MWFIQFLTSVQLKVIKQTKSMEKEGNNICMMSLLLVAVPQA